MIFTPPPAQCTTPQKCSGDDMHSGTTAHVHVYMYNVYMYMYMYNVYIVHVYITEVLLQYFR